jgi:hypothetical protein
MFLFDHGQKSCLSYMGDRASSLGALRPLKNTRLGPDHAGSESEPSLGFDFAPPRHARVLEVAAVPKEQESKRSHSSFSAHTFDTNLSVTSHNSQELRHFDGSKPKRAFKPLPPIQIRNIKNLNASRTVSTLMMRRDPDDWIERREPTARLEQELDVFLSGQNLSVIPAGPAGGYSQMSGP